MKRLILSFLFIINLGLVQAQVDTLWTKTFGGSDEDAGSSVQQTDDGGYIITGHTRSFGNGNLDIWLIKTDSNGNEEWNQIFGGSGGEYSYSVQQTTDGGYIITGQTQSYGNGGTDVWLIKTDSNGDSLWTKTFGGSDNDVGHAVQQTTDDGYIIAGWTYSYGPGGSDFWLIKTDSNGDSLWTKTFGGIDADRGYWVQQTTDGGYILTGFRYPIAYGDADFWLIKTDSNGDSLWTKTFGGDHDDRGRWVQQTTDGGYIITGATESYGNGEEDIWLIKTDSNGDSLWTKTYGGISGDGGYSVQQTTDGGYIITGLTYSYGNGSADVWLIKTDSNGDSLWTKTFGGNGWEYGNSIQKTTDGGYILTGATYSFGNGGGDVWLIKLIAHNDSPADFSLTEPSNNSEIMIDASNVDNGSITFSWGESSDANDDSLYYFMRVTSVEIGNYDIDTSATSFSVAYADIIEDMTDNNVTVATIEWTVYVTDGIDTVEADNAPFTVVIDGGYAMSTFSEALIPEAFALHQNYPNPFNPITTLRYDLPENSFVNITVYDLLGKKVKTLVNTTQNAGFKSVIWNATNNQGNPVSAGVYLYKIQAGEFVQTKKMVLLK